MTAWQNRTVNCFNAEMCFLCKTTNASRPMKLSTVEVFDTNALKYENKFMHLELYNATYDALLQNLKPGSAILELGCGPGNITRYLLDKRPDLKILATDFSEKMVELATKNLPEAEVLRLDAKEILSLNRKFDAVVCGFIAPYFSREELQKLIADCAAVSNGEAVLYISCIEGEYEKSGWMASSDGKVSAFVHYYSANDIGGMLAQAGFYEVNKFEVQYGNDVHLIFTARLRKSN